MADTTKRFTFRSAARADARGRWQLLRDVLGGALVLAAWLALWTVTWAAVAGPLSPAARGAVAAAAAATG